MNEPMIHKKGPYTFHEASAKGESRVLDPPEKKVETDKTKEAQAFYDKAMALIEKFRNDEAEVFIQKAAELGHVEALKLLVSGDKFISTAVDKSMDALSPYEIAFGEPKKLDPPERKVEARYEKDAQASYIRGMDLVKRFRNDEGVLYLKNAARLGHAEAISYLGDQNGSRQVALLDKVSKKEPGNRYDIEFTGSAEEYFRIWIVNALLTIATLGIYAAWAKVRTRRYFYANTILDGQPFDYLADPRAIFKGHLIVGVCFIIFLIGQYFNPVISFVVVGVFFIIIPLLIYKSLRFFAHNASYRNIRFRFTGTLGESYKTYMLIPLFFPLTLGLIYWYWTRRRKEFFCNNLVLGTASSSFKGNSWDILEYFFKAGVITSLVGGLLSLFYELLLSAFFGMSTDPIAPVLRSFFSFPFYIILFSIYEQFLYTRMANYCWNRTTLGDTYFESTLSAREMIKIRITNIFAIIFSIGLLTPWAKVRRTRYILDNLFVYSHRDFSEFTAGDESDDTALGEAATEMFDIDIGL